MGLVFLAKALLRYKTTALNVNRARLQTFNSSLTFCQSRFSFADTNDSQCSREGRGPILFLSTISTCSQAPGTYLQFCILDNNLLFLIATHLTTTLLLEIQIIMVQYNLICLLILCQILLHEFSRQMVTETTNRISRSQMLFKIGVLKNVAIFT